MTYFEFTKRFPTENSAIDFIVAAKDKDGYVCPKCGKHLAWALPTTIIKCPECGKWVNSKNRKIASEVFLPIDSNQLVLFPDYKKE